MTPKVQKIIEFHKSQKEENFDNIKVIFEKVLEVFVEKNYDNEFESVYCSIHKSFPKGHNCVGCNLNEDNIRLESFLVGYEHFSDVHLTFTTYILLLYLQVESIYEYFQIIKLQESYKLKHFQVFQEIKKWANFLKHPKSFILVHHPKYTYKNRMFYDDESDKFVSINLEKTKPFIDSEFVNNYYAGDKKNKELYRELNKKEDLIVEFPDPLVLIEKFTEAHKKFSKIISNNEIVRDLLDSETTIREYFTEE